jgi:hypothetical protein
MAVGIYMQNNISPAQYDEAIRKLNGAGAGEPKGRLYHAAFLEGEKVSVFDIWESQADFEAFGATLVPILNELGVELGEPAISQVHNIIAT